MSTTGEPVPFEVFEAGVYLHGTKADLAVGDMLVPGRESNFEEARVMNHVYFTATLDAAVWGAELAAGEGRGRVYVVEPVGAFPGGRSPVGESGRDGRRTWRRVKTPDTVNRC